MMLNRHLIAHGIGYKIRLFDVINCLVIRSAHKVSSASRTRPDQINSACNGLHFRPFGLCVRYFAGEDWHGRFLPVFTISAPIKTGEPLVHNSALFGAN